MDPTLILGGMKLLGGLLGGGKKAPSPRKNLLSQAQGAREASEKYGFNPLTMLQYGQTGGAAGGGAPPLASTELLLGGLGDITDVVSGEKARRDKANQLEVDLAQIQLDQARSGVLAVAPSATANVGEGLPALGRRAAMVVTPSTQVGPSNAGFPPFNGPDPRLRDPVLLNTGGGGGIRVPEPRLDRGSGSYILGGVRVESTPGWSSGQTIEDEYGELASAVYGPVKIAADLGTTLGARAYDWKHYTPMDKPPKRRPSRSASKPTLFGFPQSAPKY